MALSIDGSSLYNYYASVNDSTTSSLENSLGTDLSDAGDDELLSVCKEFEAYFIEQMYKQMEKTVPESDLTEKSQTEEYFHELLIQEYAKNSTEGQGIGIASMLYEQMKKQV